MVKELDSNKRNKQFRILEKHKSKLSNYDYDLIKGWITNWEFMGKTGNKNLMLNIKDRLN